MFLDNYVLVYGGIYIDWDEIILQPIDELRKYDYVQVNMEFISSIS